MIFEEEEEKITCFVEKALYIISNIVQYVAVCCKRNLRIKKVFLFENSKK